MTFSEPKRIRINTSSKYDPQIQSEIDTKTNQSGVKSMTGTLIMIGILVGWIALQVWILPKFGIQT